MSFIDDGVKNGLSPCDRRGCTSAGLIREALHDEAFPQRLNLCAAHAADHARLDICNHPGCTARAHRFSRCAEHQTTQLLRPKPRSPRKTMKTRLHTLLPQVREFILAHPGCTQTEIGNAVPDAALADISTAVQALDVYGEVECKEVSDGKRLRRVYTAIPDKADLGKQHRIMSDHLDAIAHKLGLGSYTPAIVDETDTLLKREDSARSALNSTEDAAEDLRDVLRKEGVVEPLPDWPSPAVLRAAAAWLTGAASEREQLNAKIQTKQDVIDARKRTMDSVLAGFAEILGKDKVEIQNLLPEFRRLQERIESAERILTLILDCAMDRSWSTPNAGIWAVDWPHIVSKLRDTAARANANRPTGPVPPMWEGDQLVMWKPGPVARLSRVSDGYAWRTLDNRANGSAIDEALARVLAEVAAGVRSPGPAAS